MIEQHIEVINKLGLHARAAARLVNEAAGFESDIKLCRDGQEVDAKSIMGIMMLAASVGTHLQIRIDGPDEQAAVNTLIGLFESRFGEDE